MLQTKRDEYEAANPVDEDAPSGNVPTTPTGTYNETVYKNIPYGKTVDTGINIISYFESKYTCSGICKSSLFYYSLNLDKGVPTSTCLMHLKTEVTDSIVYLGIASIVVGILTCCVFVVQYSLWRNYSDDANAKPEFMSGRD